MDIRIKLDGGIMPMKATPYDAAFDLYVPDDVELKLGRQVIDLGFSVELPHGYAAIIQARSGMSIRGMESRFVVSVDDCGYDFEYEHVTNIDANVIIGLVDEKYRGHVGVIIKVNSMPGIGRCILSKGSRIAQMRIVEVPDVDLVEVPELDMSGDRGGGFGHTGV